MSDNTRYNVTGEGGALPEFPAVRTPWHKLISLHDAHHFALRSNACLAAAFMQVFRILVPDYHTRAKALCEINGEIYNQMFSIPEFNEAFRDRQNIHPFVNGSMVGVLCGDQGDESLLMNGRVNEYGTYRFEKELDTCPWDIVGSEYCRCTTYFFEAIGKAYNDPSMEYHMVEAKGCGDLHCRVIGENREKWPMPPKKEVYDSFGPIATSDLIKFTPEEKCFKEPQYYRPEGNGKYRSGYCAEFTTAEQYSSSVVMPLGMNNIIPCLDELCPDKVMVSHVTKCVMEIAGKMAFSEFSSIKAMRDWLGVPADVNDGRVLGAYIEVFLQATLVEYTVKAFDENEVILDVDLYGLERDFPLMTEAYISMWYGMCKTLVNTQWALWHETEGVDDGILRLKIAKKIDKWC